VILISGDLKLSKKAFIPKYAEQLQDRIEIGSCFELPHNICFQQKNY
jgi:hypothetical protein